MSKIDDQIKGRFKELLVQMNSIGWEGSEGRYADTAAFYAWATSAMHLIKAVFGKDSPHYEQFSSEMEKVVNNYINGNKLATFKGIFVGAKLDVDGGYLFNVTGSVTGEIFADFVGAAKSALSEGNHTVAAVLGSAALEDALKRYALSEGLDVENKTMDEVVGALKSKGLVSGTQKGLLAPMPKIRNHAMHAEWDKITAQDAGSVIGFVEQFLLTHFP